MKWNRTFLVLLGITMCLLFSHADSDVGKVLSVQGEVRIDAFGKNTFLDALEGDLLYESSVIRTGNNGTAVLLILDKRTEIPPGAGIRVVELLETQQRTRSIGWFQALGRFLGDILESAGGSEEEVALGSRASEGGSEEESVAWVEEMEDDDELFLSAQEKIGEQDYSGALADLLQIESEESFLYLEADLNFWKGFCYFQMEGYADAREHLARAHGEELFAEYEGEILPINRVLPFQLGASLYILGNEEESISYLEEVIAEKAKDEYTFYSFLLLIPILVATGQEEKARVRWDNARELFKGTDQESDIAGLADIFGQ